jgi:hypothetical protein
MATKQSSSGSNQSRTSTSTSTSTDQTSKGQQNVTAYARQAAETAVDLPVGAALSVADRVNDTVKPYRTRSSAEREIRRLRNQLQRELNRAERRGGTARRKLTTRAKRERNRVEREVNARRRRVETAVRQNRRKAERQLKTTRTRVNQRVNQLV